MVDSNSSFRSKCRTSSEYERELRRAQLRLHRLLSLKYALQYMTLWTLLWGTVSLVLRILFGTSALGLLLGALGWIPSVIAAFLVSKRKVPELATLRAWADQKSSCGGLLMASQEVDAGRWSEQLPSATLPHFTWSGSRLWLFFLASLFFMGSTLLVPKQQLLKPKENFFAIDDQVGALKKQIKGLQRERALTKNKAKSLEKKLENLRKKAKATDPVKTLQALDHLSQKLKNLARERADKLLSQADKWGRTEKLATQLSKFAKSMKPSKLSKSMRELSKMLKQAMDADPQLKKMLTKTMSKELQRALMNKSLKVAQLKSVAKVCRRGANGSIQKMSKLSKLKLLSPKAVKQMKMAGRLVRGPGRLGKNGKLASVGRGPSLSLMSFKSPKRIMGAKFKAKVLPPSKVLNLLSSRNIGMSVGRPDEKLGKAGQSGSTGVLGKQVGGSSRAHSHKIFPQHLGTVKRYFQRGK